jgi:RNA polymerase sigma-70 factor, ECF subfamily
VTVDPVDPVAAFEEQRPHLLRVGYRITGSLADAEDAVQEAWLRWSRRPADLREPRAWLTTVVARICLDRLTAAAARRERYVGPWLPEPLVTAPDDDGPLAAVVRGEDVRLAAILLLDALTPAQRVAFVLHEALGTRYAEIGEVLGCSADSARQHAAAARRSVAGSPVPARAPAEAERRVLAAFAEALGRGDLQALVGLLHPDVVFTSDGGGTVPTALRTIVGAEKVGRLFTGLGATYAFDPTRWVSVLVNGEPGIATPATDAMVPTVAAVTVDAEGRITALRHVMNPEKLRPWW